MPDVPASTVVTATGTLFVVNTVVRFAVNNLWEEITGMGFVQARFQARQAGCTPGPAAVCPS